MKKITFWICFFVLNASVAFSSQTGDPPISFADRAEKAIPAVVTIVKKINHFDLYYGSDPDSYWEYFRFIHEAFWPPSYCHGSGFIISPDGYVVTNAHVVDDGTSVLVAVHGRVPRLHEATIVGLDYGIDLAVLKIESDQPFPYLEFGNSLTARVSDPIMIIGSPVTPRLESTVTMGVISGKERNNFGIDPIEGYIQTDAPINGGNSGGPVLNHEGKVIGIVNWSYPWREGLGFAIPSHLAKCITDQIIENGETTYGFLGIHFESDTEKAFINSYLFPYNNGTRISEIIKGSPADRGGLKVGDIIREMNGYSIISPQSLRNQIVVLGPNTEVDLVIEREGKTLHLFVTLGEQEPFLNLYGSKLMF